MSPETHTEGTPNERLHKKLPEIGQRLNKLWKSFGNRSIGFAGGGNLVGDPQPDEVSHDWLEEANELLVDCEVNIGNYYENIVWGEIVVSLSDLVDELRFYWSPLWKKVSHEERARTKIRMDMNAQKFLDILKERGFIEQEQKPFNLDS